MLSDTRSGRPAESAPLGGRPASATRGHPFSPPATAGTACTECGYGPASPRHAATTMPSNVAVAREVAHLWLEGITGLGGNTEAWGTAALRAVLAALDGETDLRKLYLSGLRMRVTPDGLVPYAPDGDQEQLPLAS